MIEQSQNSGRQVCPPCVWLVLAQATAREEVLPSQYGGLSLDQKEATACVCHSLEGRCGALVGLAALSASVWRYQVVSTRAPPAARERPHGPAASANEASTTTDSFEVMSPAIPDALGSLALCWPGLAWRSLGLMASGTEDYCLHRSHITHHTSQTTFNIVYHLPRLKPQITARASR